MSIAHRSDVTAMTPGTGPSNLHRMVWNALTKSNEGLCRCMLDAVFIVVPVQESRGTALLFGKVLGIEVRVAKLIWC